MTTDGEQVWRVVEPDGSVNVLHAQDIGGGVYIIRCDTLGREHVAGASSRCAVERFAGRYLGIAEIRGPGEATTAEQLAAATARAEAAEQENARLRAALRSHALTCRACGKVATWLSVFSVTPSCDDCRTSWPQSYEWREMGHADVLRSLDGVTR